MQQIRFLKREFRIERKRLHGSYLSSARVATLQPESDDREPPKLGSEAAAVSV
jgi:hypothetical protein